MLRAGVWTYRRLTGDYTESATPSSGQNGTIVVLGGTNLLGYGQSLVAAILAGVSAQIKFANLATVW